MFDHPRWGVIPCLASIHAIQEEEEIFVKYGYDLDFCPDWYLAAWEQGRLKIYAFPNFAKSPFPGNYPVPDSMKGEYDVNPAWASKTQEDLEDTG